MGLGLNARFVLFIKVLLSYPSVQLWTLHFCWYSSWVNTAALLFCVLCFASVTSHCSAEGAGITVRSCIVNEK